MSATKPAYYQSSAGDALDFIEAHGLNFARGNVVKYITRAGKKSPETELQDLEKAAEYLRREIERLKKENEPCH